MGRKSNKSSRHAAPADPAAARNAAGRLHEAIDNPSYLAVTRPVHTGAIGRWQHYAEWFEPLLPKLERLLKSFGYQ